MKITIRQEKKTDHLIVKEIIKAAFAIVPLSDETEHLLVERLRNSNAFIPELPLVAEINSKIVGHILLTKIKIKNQDKIYDSLALAPIAVDPNYQLKGIGGKLINEAHKIAQELGHQSIVLIGHENYYPKFGYKKASLFNIKLPFEAPDENCMLIELIEDGLKDVSGIVEYPKEFYN